MVEVVSPKTQRSDLGMGRGDRADRWRTYLENGVPEYWVVNPGFEGLLLPPRSGLFLAPDRERRRFVPLAFEGETPRSEHRGVPVLRRARVRSRALPGLVLDLRALWREALGR